MASIIKIGKRWRAQIRRRSLPTVAQTFDTKTRAQEWAAKTESDMKALKFQDVRIISDITLNALIQRYAKEVGGIENIDDKNEIKKADEAGKGFGKNKTAVLRLLKNSIGNILLPDLTVDRLTQYMKDRSTETAYKEAAGGVTINIDLTYLSTVLKTAKQLWRLPINLDVIADARANMPYLGLSTRSNERTRRPTQTEIDNICTHFQIKMRQEIPMPDIIHFAVGTAMRLGEITGIRWANLNEVDKTIIIRDRKHPREKKGNDQEVPLLGSMFDIIKRQPKIGGEPRIFPWPGGSISSIFPHTCHELGIENLRFHDLRHEGVSRLFEQGYGIEQVALMSGHKDWKMLARYTQIQAKSLHRPAIEVMSPDLP